MEAEVELGLLNSAEANACGVKPAVHRVREDSAASIHADAAFNYQEMTSPTTTGRQQRPMKKIEASSSSSHPIGPATTTTTTTTTSRVGRSPLEKPPVLPAGVALEPETADTVLEAVIERDIDRLRHLLEIVDLPVTDRA